MEYPKYVFRYGDEGTAPESKLVQNADEETEANSDGYETFRGGSKEQKNTLPETDQAAGYIYREYPKFVFDKKGYSRRVENEDEAEEAKKDGFHSYTVDDPQRRPDLSYDPTVKMATPEQAAELRSAKALPITQSQLDKPDQTYGVPGAIAPERSAVTGQEAVEASRDAITASTGESTGESATPFTGTVDGHAVADGEANNVADTTVRKPYERWTKAELVAEAQQLGLLLPGDEEPNKADLIAILRA